MVLRHAAVCKLDSIFLIKGFGCKIVVTVLVMDTKEVTHLMHGIYQRFHAFPAACFFTCRCVIRVLVIVTGLSPAIQMHIKLFHAKLMKGSCFFFALCKGVQRFVVLRVIFVIEA